MKASDFLVWPKKKQSEQEQSQGAKELAFVTTFLRSCMCSLTTVVARCQHSSFPRCCDRRFVPRGPVGRTVTGKCMSQGSGLPPTQLDRAYVAPAKRHLHEETIRPSECTEPSDFITLPCRALHGLFATVPARQVPCKPRCGQPTVSDQDVAAEPSVHKGFSNICTAPLNPH